MPEAGGRQGSHPCQRGHRAAYPRTGCIGAGARPARSRDRRQAAAFFRLASSRASTNATVASRRDCAVPFCAAMACTSRSTRSMLGAPLMSARAAEDGRDQPLGGSGVFLERHQIVGRGAQLDAQVAHPVVDRPRSLEVGMHGFLDGDGAVFGHAAVIAGQQHRPLGERHEDRIVHLQLHRQFDLAIAGIEADRLDVVAAAAAGWRCACRNRSAPTLKLVGSVTCSTLIFSSGGRIACGSGLHSVSNAGIEIVPHAGIGVGSCSTGRC